MIRTSDSRKPALFLDFDGVLHPVRAEVDQLFCRLGLLEEWLRRRPEVDVVISSSWRNGHSFEELKSFFAEDLRERVIGVTGLHWKQVYEETGEMLLMVRHERELEARRWLANCGSPERPWAALDDLQGNYRPDSRHLVVCDPSTGLTNLELDALDQVLGLQQLASDKPPNES